MSFGQNDNKNYWELKFDIYDNIDIKEDEENDFEKAREFDPSQESVLEESPERGRLERDGSIRKTVKKIGVGTVGRVARVIKQVSGPLRRKQ